MTEKYVFKSYLQSLLWIGLFTAVGAAFTIVVDVFAMDVFFGNPYRTHIETLQTALIMTPLLALISVIVVLLVFTFPQLLQAVVASGSSRWSPLKAATFVVATVPVTTVLTWYCWEYLTPTDFSLGVNEGADWKPYQHGLTWSRYQKSLACQTPETLFSVCYLHAASLKLTRRKVVVSGLAIAAVVGGIGGYAFAWFGRSTFVQS